MVSRRRAVCALALPPFLGALAYANFPDRPAVAGAAALTLAGYLTVELLLWGGRQAEASRRTLAAERRAAARIAPVLDRHYWEG